MKALKYIYAICILFFGLTSCKEDYLDVVPDNVATIDHAFSDHVQARKYLFTCYNFLPSSTGFYDNPAILAGDEFWLPEAHYDNEYKNSPMAIARGFQTSVAPLANKWEGNNSLYVGIRQCNVFIDNIDRVPNMDDSEKIRLKAEVNVLKAYYHFYLLRMYGPIPVIRTSLPVSADPEEVKYFREPVDACFEYIVELIDSNIDFLPLNVPNAAEELGRITIPIAKAIKARALVLAASPLFNGNNDLTNFVGKDGEPYFPAFDNEKWKITADACLDAINSAHETGHSLYQVNAENTNLDEMMLLKATLRNRVPERWNSEIIWGDSKNSGSTSGYQYWAQANLSNRLAASKQALAVTFNIVDEYLTKNGLPTDEDITWDEANALEYRLSTEEDKYHIKTNEEIPALHFGREPRFYADLGFDRSTWHWQGVTDVENPRFIFSRKGEQSGKKTIWEYNVTGYFPKKVCSPANIFSSDGTYIRITYAFPIIRLADLYLLYAEAVNEYYGPSEDAYNYLDMVRERAGIPKIMDSYAKFSNNPSKPTTTDGLREIIHRERLIELTFEGRRYWDIRRWKKGQEYLNQNVFGWNTEVLEKDDYYQKRKLGLRKFTKRDYFWPLRDYHLTINPNLEQNPGW
ncbi:MAG: RagB/SusD family nutrient uptake outer membrane protein [Cytophagales bacterium]|nr:RagB/SusD family nutrient uptake outer membrane protein [Cytophagales bacterium]